MTAEIAIMNKSAVALAADSAVTFGRKDSLKIYNSVNKLFELSTIQPVGVMIYGSAELAGVPWETLIKNFRSELGRTSFDDLEEYKVEFSKYLESKTGYFSKTLYQNEIGSILYKKLYALFSKFRIQFSKELSQKGLVSRSRVAEILNEQLAENIRRVEKFKPAIGIDQGNGEKILSRYENEYDQVLKAVFEKYPLTDFQRAQVRLYCGLAMEKIFPDRERDYSGVVFAGFGRKNNFPVLFELKIDTIVDGKLKLNYGAKVRIGPDDMQASINPFAQSEMVHTFIEGIDPKHVREHDAAFQLVVEKTVEIVLKRIGKTKLNKKRIAGEVSSECKKVIEKNMEALEQIRRERNIDPIISAVVSLPKDELAAMAESLVNLTSFRRRVSMDKETVGGPIDVAVISKGDGFIWIKRKHYFDTDLNPRYAGRTMGHFRRWS